MKIIVILMLLSMILLISGSSISSRNERSAGDQEVPTNTFHCFHWKPGSSSQLIEVSVTDKSKCQQFASRMSLTFSLVVDSDSQETQNQAKSSASNYAVNIGIDVYKDLTNVAAHRFAILLEPKGDFLKWRYILLRWDASNQRHDVILVSKSGKENTNGCYSRNSGRSSGAKDWVTRDGISMSSSEQKCNPILRLSGEEMDLLHTPFDISIIEDDDDGSVFSAQKHFVTVARTVTPIALIAGMKVPAPHTTSETVVGTKGEEKIESQKTETQGNDWFIVAVILGVILIIILVVVVLFFLCRKKGKHHGHHLHGHGKDHRPDHKHDSLAPDRRSSLQISQQEPKKSSIKSVANSSSPGKSSVHGHHHKHHSGTSSKIPSQIQKGSVGHHHKHGHHHPHHQDGGHPSPNKSHVQSHGASSAPQSRTSQIRS